MAIYGETDSPRAAAEDRYPILVLDGPRGRDLAAEDRNEFARKVWQESYDYHAEAGRERLDGEIEEAMIERLDEAKASVRDQLTGRDAERALAAVLPKSAPLSTLPRILAALGEFIDAELEI